jgi:DNA-binding NtrC family response regulator
VFTNKVSNTVLVVDDDRAMWEVVRAILTRGGFKVITSSDALEAWQILEESAEPIDLVIAEAEMPVIDSSELLKRVREKYPDIPLVLIGGIEPWWIEVYIGEHVRFLQKPFAPQVLVRVVRHALSRRSMRPSA